MKQNKKITTAAALRYMQRDQAPVVIDKGRGKAADRILECAARFGIPVKKNDIASYLMRVEKFTEIDPFMFTIIAEIYTEIYRLDNSAARNSVFNGESQ
ncbi:MAG TPA: EscU/YscU/HrcU family type III secretion system export apparatus switch protein [Spirochaetota bacterium]|nr:EscU/YscU/HrcU family type III secretion system export apparatus switch protein [Spirochaetota bacterium]